MAAARSTGPAVEVGLVASPAILAALVRCGSTTNDSFLDLSPTGSPCHEQAVVTGCLPAAKVRQRHPRCARHRVHAQPHGLPTPAPPRSLAPQEMSRAACTWPY